MNQSYWRLRDLLESLVQEGNLDEIAYGVIAEEVEGLWEAETRELEGVLESLRELRVDFFMKVAPGAKIDSDLYWTMLGQIDRMVERMSVLVAPATRMLAEPSESSGQ